MGTNHTNMGCGGGDENKNDEIIVEGDGEVVVPLETKITVFVSADADSPNFLIKMLCYDWMTMAHVGRRVQEVLNAADEFEGECEFVTGIGPVWGDGWDVFPDDCRLWDVEGFDVDDDEQMFAAHTADLNPSSTEDSTSGLKTSG